jgi:hypothetical protein
MPHFYKINLSALFLFACIGSFFAPSGAHAQWAFDPANPGALCDAPNLQRFSSVFTISDNRYMALWQDNRNGQIQLYRQILDLEGNALLEENGEPLSELMDFFINVSAIRDADGNIAVVWGEVQNASPSSYKIKVLMFNADGDQIWDQPKMLAESDFVGPDYIGPIALFLMYSDSDGFGLVFHHVPFGGNVMNHIRFTADENEEPPLNGTQFFNQFFMGSFRLATDYAGGAYILYSSGNGLGAPAYLMRINQSGEVVWPGINVLEGTGGLGYNFTMLSDPHGVAVMWEEAVSGTGVDFRMRRFSASGSPLWNGNTVEVSNSIGSPSHFRWAQRDGYYQFAWTDNPVPNVSQSFVQVHRIDTLGNNIWPANGIQVAQVSNYTVTPSFTFDAQDRMLLLYNGTDGIKIDRILSDGSLDPQVNQVLVANPDVSVGSEAQKTFAMHGDNIIVAWTHYFNSFSDSDLHFSAPASTLSAGALQGNAPDLLIYPNPVAGNVLRLSATKAGVISDISGRVISTFTLSDVIDVGHLAAGIYLLQPVGEKGVRFVKE